MQIHIYEQKIVENWLKQEVEKNSERSKRVPTGPKESKEFFAKLNVKHLHKGHQKWFLWFYLHFFDKGKVQWVGGQKFGQPWVVMAAAKLVVVFVVTFLSV